MTGDQVSASHEEGCGVPAAFYGRGEGERLTLDLLCLSSVCFPFLHSAFLLGFGCGFDHKTTIC